MKWLVQSGVTCACDIDPVYGIHVATSTTFFSDGSTCTGAPGGCANQVMQGNWSNMVPWNLVNSSYGQGAGTSFPGTGQLNGQTPIGIWSVNNSAHCTNGGNDFGEPYIWFTQQNTDPSTGECIPNPANCNVSPPNDTNPCDDFQTNQPAMVSICCEWCLENSQTPGGMYGPPPTGCFDWMCDCCKPPKPPKPPKPSEKMSSELKEEIKRIKELL